MIDARLKTPEETRPLTREECIVETVLGIIGGATMIEDGIERRIGPHDISAVSPTGGLPDHAAAPRASRKQAMRAPGEWLLQSQSTARSAYGDAGAC